MNIVVFHARLWRQLLSEGRVESRLLVRDAESTRSSRLLATGEDSLVVLLYLSICPTFM